MGRHIAVLGGGLTGLSAAFHLSRRLPASRITLIERNKELGGWVKSKRVTLPGKGTVLLEAGPRTLRPNAPSVLELVRRAVDMAQGETNYVLGRYTSWV